MLKAIDLSNLRSLTSTGSVELRPLTILVGRNSSGKSTLLRVFPLLRQSIEARTTGPLLWYGSYVDFGSFDKAVHNQRSTDSIIFRFTLRVPGFDPGKYRGPRVPHYAPLAQTTDISVALTLKENQSTFVQECRLDLLDDSIIINLTEDGKVKKLSINDRSLDPHELGYSVARTINLVPLLNIEQAHHDYRYHYLFRGEESGKSLSNLVEAIRPLFHHRSQDFTISNVAVRLAISGTAGLLSQMQKMPKSAGVTFLDRVEAMSETDRILEPIREAIIAYHLPVLLIRIDDLLAQMSHSVRYIAPIRATAERYYRSQELAVDEVDFRGTNMAMFLRSLSSEAASSFTEWTSKHLAFDVSAKADQSGHLWLELHEDGASEKHNLADMGFGFSQVLPISAQLWSLVRESRSRTRSGGHIFAIEQPELHLHPAYQARLADLFVNSIAESPQDLRLLIETHSSAIINRLGTLVAEAKIAPSDINVIVFEKRPGEATKVSTAEYDTQGQLIDWPYGFFEPDIT